MGKQKDEVTYEIISSKITETKDGARLDIKVRETIKEQKRQAKLKKEKEKQQRQQKKRDKQISGLLPDKKRLTVKDYRDFMNKYGEKGLSRLSEKELRKLASPIMDNTRRNVRRLIEKGYAKDSKAFQYMQETGGMFSTKNMNVNQLRHELARINHFNRMETSTVQRMSDMYKRMKEKFGVARDVLEKFSKQAWKLYDKFADKNYIESQMIGYEKGIKSIFNMLQEGKSPSSIMRSLTSSYRSEFQRRGSIGGFRSRW